MNLSKTYGEYDLWVCLLFLAAAAGLVIGYDWRLGIPTVFALLVGTILYFLISRTAVNLDRWNRAALFLVMMGAAAALFFLGQMVIHHLTQPGDLLAHLAKVFSPLLPDSEAWKHYGNAIATFLEGIFFASLAAARLTKTRRNQQVMVICAALIGAAILLSQSRGAWVGSFFALLIWGALYSRFMRWGLVALFASLLLLAGYVFFQGSIEAIRDIPLASAILEPLFLRPDRLAVYQNSLALIADAPFTGIGVGSQFGFVYSRYELGIPYVFLRYSHNLWLETWLELGLAGLIVLILLVVSLLLRVWRLCNLPGRFWFESTWIGLLAIFIHGLFDATMYDYLWSGFTVFYLLGLNAAFPVNPPVAPKPREKGGKLGGLLIMIIAFAISFHPLPARWYTNLGSLEQHKADLSTILSQEQRTTLLAQAESHFQRALQLEPAQRSANQRLGMIALKRDEFTTAVRYFEAAHRANPAHYATQKLYGFASMFSGNLELAETLLKPFPELQDEINYWGWSFASRGLNHPALNAYRLSLRLFPNQPDIQNQIRELELK
jgi:O-antigen ligase